MTVPGRPAPGTPEGLEVVEAAGGRLVVRARRPLPAGSWVEESPVVVLPPGQMRHVQGTAVDRILYPFGPQGRHRALALGLGSLFIASSDANLRCVGSWPDRCLQFYARRDIAAGEVLTVERKSSGVA